MSKRWMGIVCLLAAVFLATGTAALSAKSEEHEDEAEISGSVAVPSKETMLANMAKVTLVDAVSAALKAAPGKAVAAELEEDDGFLVYAVEIVTADNKVTEVVVDAGNKKILKTETEECCGSEKGGHKNEGHED